MLNTHFQGKVTEMQVALAFLQKGYQISQPLVADSRYDFIVDIKNHLIRLQVKTCKEHLDEGYVDFATSTSHTNTQGTINHSYTEKEIDYFATFYNGQCYIISVTECGARNQRLRITPPKNGNQRGSKMLADYTIDKFIDTLID